MKKWWKWLGANYDPEDVWQEVDNHANNVEWFRQRNIGSELLIDTPELMIARFGTSANLWIEWFTEDPTK